MLQLLDGFPSNVVVISASGEVTGDDYESVLIPAIESALEQHEKIRLLYHFGPEFTGFSASGMWDDTRVGLRHFTHFDKIAVVTDEEWLMQMIKVFGFVVPGEVRVFPEAELDTAKGWITE